MKRIMKWLIPLLIAALLIGSAVWYIFVYDRSTIQDFLTAQARNCAERGDFDAATWFYSLSYKLSGQDQNVAIELAEIYKSVGNYTKAEYTLTNAVADGGNAELYMALCRTYVEQDKLLDAVNMLDNIADPAVKAELDAMRPAAPTADHDPGFYSQYITLTFAETSGTLYVTMDGQYPSTADTPYAEPVALGAGETKVYALVVDENGLVSPLSILNYTIGGVIEEVTLTDPAIAESIRGQLLFGADTAIMTSDLWTITEFTVPEGAASLADLAYLTYLEKLTISDMSIDSLDFLSGLTKLKELNISDCSVSASLSILTTLPELKSLTLSGCSLSTIAELAGAQALASLDLSSNAIGDITPLSDMSMLTKLDLSNNAVTDLSALSGLTKLVELDISYNSVSSISAIGGCSALTKLDITNNSIADLSVVSVLPALTRLYAGYNSLFDVSVLSNAVQLQELCVSNNVLTDISSLSALVNLTMLDFSYNDVTVLPALPSNCALVTINGEHNQLTDISALGGMENLNYVYMDYNEISDITFLANCPNLIQVNVYGTNVSEDEVNTLLDRSIIVNFDPT